MIDFNRYTDFLDCTGQLKILVIGDVMIDSYIWGNVTRISPEAPVPVVSVEKRENLLGGAANVALNIKALGANPILCSYIGKDAKGDEFLDICKNENLSTEGLLKSDSRNTTTKFRVIGNNSQLIRVDEESLHDLNDEETKNITIVFNNIINDHNISAIILQDYNKGLLTNARQIADTLITVSPAPETSAIERM